MISPYDTAALTSRCPHCGDRIRSRSVFKDWEIPAEIAELELPEPDWAFWGQEDDLRSSIVCYGRVMFRKRFGEDASFVMGQGFIHFVVRAGNAYEGRLVVGSLGDNGRRFSRELLLNEPVVLARRFELVVNLKELVEKSKTHVVRPSTDKGKGHYTVISGSSDIEYDVYLGKDTKDCNCTHGQFHEGRACCSHVIAATNLHAQRKGYKLVGLKFRNDELAEDAAVMRLPQRVDAIVRAI